MCVLGRAFRGYKNKLLKAKLKKRLRQRQTELETNGQTDTQKHRVRETESTTEIYQQFWEAGRTFGA